MWVQITFCKSADKNKIRKNKNKTDPVYLVS